MTDTAVAPQSTATTEEMLEHASAWFLQALGLQDWEVSLDTTTEPPAWYSGAPTSNVGGVRHRTSYKQADVWVPIRRHNTEREALETLFHELLHINAEDCGLVDDGAGRIEYAWNRIAFLIAEAFCNRTRQLLPGAPEKT